VSEDEATKGFRGEDEIVKGHRSEDDEVEAHQRKADDSDEVEGHLLKGQPVKDQAKPA